MIVAKTSKAAGRLSRQFRERSTRKIYRAVVEGRPDRDQATLRHRLLKDRAKRITRVVQAGAEGKEAVLTYQILDSTRNSSLVEVELLTGLSHQIRVQLSTIGCPILADRKYGATMSGATGTIALYAHSITFRHPVKKEPLTITADPPNHWPWIEKERT